MMGCQARSADVILGLVETEFDAVQYSTRPIIYRPNRSLLLVYLALRPSTFSCTSNSIMPSTQFAILRSLAFGQAIKECL